MIRIFNVPIPPGIAALFASELALLVTCYLCISALLIPVDPYIFLVHDQGTVRIVIVVAAILLGYQLQDLYAVITVRSILLLLQQISVALGFALVVQAIVGYIYPPILLPRTIMLAGAALSLPILLGWRLLFVTLAAQTQMKETVVFVGANRLSTQLAQTYAHSPALGLHCSGFIDDAGGSPNDNTPILGSLSDLKRIVRQLRPDHLVISLFEGRSRLPMTDLIELRNLGITVEPVMSSYEAIFRRTALAGLRPADLIFVGGSASAKASNLKLQTLFSISVAVCLLIILSPLMLLIALFIKLSSQGPVLCRYTRVGKNQQLFSVLRFRSIRQQADIPAGAEAESDPRLIPLGKWLRDSRLDALPELFNVLRGEMAMVGPRPERPAFTQSLVAQIPFYRQRTSVKPGITGWTQVNYKYDGAVEDTILKFEYDLYYIKNVSVPLDLYILFLATKNLIFGWRSE